MSGDEKMFCKKCGIKLSEKDSTCKNCGASAEVQEYCGGFFGLVREVPAPTPVAAPSSGINPDTVRYQIEVEKEKAREDMRKKAVMILSAVCAVLLIVLLIQTMQISKLGAKLGKYDEAMTVMQQENQELKQSNEEIKSILTMLNCDHKESDETPYNRVYSRNAETPEGTHDVTVTCHCGKSLDKLNGNELCEDGENADGICDACLEKLPCDHGESMEKTYKTNDDGTHKVTCKCGEIVAENEACEDVNTDEDGKCDLCKADVVCDHAGTGYAYTAAGEPNKHEARCKQCYEVEKTEDCADKDQNQACDKCEQALDATIVDSIASIIS